METILNPAEFARHTDYLVAFAQRRLGDPDLARDAVQETFLAALAAAGGFRGQASSRTWLTGILKHKIADSFRERSGAPVSLDAEPETIEAVAVPTADQPEERFEQGRWLAIVDRQLRRLPARVREVFLQTEIGGESDADVARSLGISAVNLTSMRYRARQSLREALAPVLAS